MSLITPKSEYFSVCDFPGILLHIELEHKALLLCRIIKRWGGGAVCVCVRLPTCVHLFLRSVCKIKLTAALPLDRQPRLWTSVWLALCYLTPFPGEFCIQTVTSLLVGKTGVVLIKKYSAFQYICEVRGAVTQPDVEAPKLGLIILFYCWLFILF